jgi:hypothetical protein
MAQIDDMHAPKSHKEAAKAQHSTAALHATSDGKEALEVSRKANEFSQAAHQEANQASKVQYARN